MNSLKLKIPSLPDNIRIVESFIDNARDEFHFDDNIYGNIMVAVTEAVNNAIVHGNGSNPEKSVELSLDISENFLQFIIEDEGEGFEFEDLPDPTAPENLLNPGGRGIFLIQHLVDEVDFGENGRIIKMGFAVTNDDEIE